MWTKPYGMKEGFLIGGGLIIAGLMLELSSGPGDWDASDARTRHDIVDRLV